jgi:hypothetical protein
MATELITIIIDTSISSHSTPVSDNDGGIGNGLSSICPEKLEVSAVPMSVILLPLLPAPK